MKARDSGMPPEEMWRGFFDAPEILRALDVVGAQADIVEFGCGYGTFTVEAARRTRGLVRALDIEESMVRATEAKAREFGLTNIRALRRDIIADGTGLDEASVDCALLFNILHTELPVPLLREALRVLRPGGRVGIIHWIHDASTPRGPALAIRPRPEQCREWLHAAGFVDVSATIDLPPYHYGLSARKA